MHVAKAQIATQQQNAQQQHTKIDADFGILKIRGQAAAGEGKIVRGVVHACQRGKKDGDCFNADAVKMRQRIVIAGKTAQTGDGKSVNQRIPPIHTGFIQRQTAGDGQQNIGNPQPLGGFGNARGEAGFFHRRGHFHLEELAATNAQQRQNGNDQHDDAHAANPVQKGAPDVERARQAFHVRQNAGAGGGQSGIGFKVSVGKAQVNIVEQQRQGAEVGQDEPDQGNQQKTITGVKVAPLFLAGSKPDEQAAQKGDATGSLKMLAGAVFQNQRADQRKTHQQAENGNHDAQRVDDGKSTAAHEG